MPITSLPATLPARNQSQTEFDANAASLMMALPPVVAEANALEANVNVKEVSAVAAASAAATSASTASAAAATAVAVTNALPWVSGQTYAAGAAALSLVDTRAYRRQSTGSGTVDPFYDSANWNSVLPADGGALATADVVLTRSSPAAQSITPPGFGFSFYLPDATTCRKGALLFNLRNAGEYPVAVRNSTGSIIGFMAPDDAAAVGLADNTTAAGVWVAPGLERTGITAQYAVTGMPGGVPVGNYGVNPIFPNPIRVLVLDANRTLFLWSGGSSTYAMIYDKAARAWGTPVAVRGGSTMHIRAILNGANQVLVATCGQSTTAMQYVTLTLSGTTTISVNSAVSVTLTANIALFGDLIAVGASFAFSYAKATPAVVLVAITISGTVPTISAETVQAGTSVSGATWDSNLMNLYAVSSTVVLAISATSGTVTARPYTITGASIAGGTGINIGSGGNYFRVYPVNGRWAIFYDQAGIYTGVGLVSVTGAVATLSQSTNVFTPPPAGNVFAAVAVGNKLVVAIGASSALQINIVTDTAGTVSVGTLMNFTFQSTHTYLVALPANGSTVRFAFATADVMGQLAIDYSGSSPAASSFASVGVTTAAGVAGLGATTGPAMVTAGVKAHAIRFALGAGTYAATAGASQPGLFVPKNGSLVIAPSYMSAMADGSAWGFGGPLGITSSAGVAIQHIEAAI